MSAVDAVRQVVSNHGARILLIEAATGRAYTYAETWQLAWRVAGRLAVLGAAPADRVALIMPNSLELALLYFACLQLGAVATPITPALSRQQLGVLIKLARPKVIVTTPGLRDLVDEPSDANVWLVSTAAERATTGQTEMESVCENPLPIGRALSDTTENGLFSITFTSGTTGVPKGVAHRVAGMLGASDCLNRHVGIDHTARFVHLLPMTYMAGLLNTLLSPFMAGASVIIAGRFDARMALRFWDSVIPHAGNTFWMSPTIVSMLLQIDRNPRGREYCRQNVRTILVGTAPLSTNHRSTFETIYGTQLLESYGLSEHLFITANRIRSSNTVGEALPGVELRLTDEQDRELGPGLNGAIAVRSPYLMAGYLNSETGAVDAIDPDAFLPTGDLGCLEPSGMLRITGRTKDLIIRGGTNVSPSAIEEVVASHPSVEEVSVVGVRHPHYGEDIVAAIKLKEGREFAADEPSLFAICRERLSEVQMPARFVVVQDFPRAISGKIQKNILRTQIEADSRIDLGGAVGR